MACNNCTHKKNTPRDEKEAKDLLLRLNRIEGQIRGIRSMIEEDRYCGDVLIQIAAAKKALEKVASIVLDTHLRTCVREGIESGDDKIIEETIGLFERLK